MKSYVKFDIKMYSSIIVIVLSAFISNIFAAEYCYSEVVGACSPVDNVMENCNAKYGGIDDTMKELQNYVNLQINRNWQFLLLSVHFANYETNRPGFTELHKSYADTLWNDAIDEIKHITKRGGHMDFFYKKKNPNQAEIDNYDVTELASLGKAIDLWKSVAEEGHYIHRESTRRHDKLHDPEVASHIENKYVHKHADIIRDLSGNINELKVMLNKIEDSNVALFLFDNFLKKMK